MASHEPLERLKTRLKELSRRALIRQPCDSQALGDGRTRVAGRELLDFCSNDYLGLARHPALAQASAQAALDAGAGSGGSRLLSGSHPALGRLEARLAGYSPLLMEPGPPWPRPWSV